MRSDDVKSFIGTFPLRKEGLEGIGDGFRRWRPHAGRLRVMQLRHGLQASRHLHWLQLPALLEEVEEGSSLDLWEGSGGMAVDEVRADGAMTTCSIQKGLVGDDAAEDEAGEVRRHGRRSAGKARCGS